MVPVFIVWNEYVCAGIVFCWIRISTIHFSLDLFLALGLNVIIAFLYEAFPEEILTRSYLYKVLRLRMNTIWALMTPPHGKGWVLAVANKIKRRSLKKEGGIFMSKKTAEEWNALYVSGEYQQHWEFAHPSNELVAFVAAGS